MLSNLIVLNVIFGNKVDFIRRKHHVAAALCSSALYFKSPIFSEMFHAERTQRCDCVISHCLFVLAA